MSFKIDIRGLKRFEGMEEFSIQQPAIRNYTIEALAKALAKEEIVSPRHHYSKIICKWGILRRTHVEEGISRELIEKPERRYGPVFQ